MKLEGYVEHIIYRNTENGYSVLNLVSDGEETTVVGTFHYISEGSRSIISKVFAPKRRTMRAARAAPIPLMAPLPR